MNVRNGSEARIRGNLKRTLGVIDPQTVDQKHIADVFSLLGERPLAVKGCTMPALTGDCQYARESSGQASDKPQGRKPREWQCGWGRLQSYGDLKGSTRSDGAQIVALCLGGELAHPHIVDHALAQWIDGLS